MATAVKTEKSGLALFEQWVDENELTLDSGDDLVLEPFQKTIITDFLAGFREVWVIIPEGNAKTTLFGLIALYHADHTHSPWVPMGAASRDQAEIIFGQAGGFVERSPKMQERFRVYDGYRKIKCATGGRGIKVYAADANTGDGVIPTLALIDEPHRAKDMGLYRLWKGKLGKRGGQIGTMSTAGEPGSEFEQMRERIRSQALNRVHDGCHLRAEGGNLVYHEWMVPKIEDARNLEIVKAANPLAQITIEELEGKLASETLDFNEDWLRLTCNIPTRSSYAAIPEADWDACEVSEGIPEGVPISVGADFAWLEDTTSLVPFWVKSPQYRLFGAPYVLEPPRDGTMLDAQEVKNAFLELHERNKIEVVVMDPTKAEDIAQWLSEELGCTVIPRDQTNAWAIIDYDFFIEALRERWIKHTGDETFRTHVLSAIRARLPGDRYRFDRPRVQRKASRQQRRIVIDALTAASMVHSVIAGGEQPGDYMVDVESLLDDLGEDDEL